MISRLPGQRRHRCAKAKQVIYASNMHGTESGALTSQQITELRRQMGKCIWGKRNPRNLIGALLLYEDSGLADPYVVMVKRQVSHWRQMIPEKVITDEELNILWEEGKKIQVREKVQSR